MFSSIPEAWDRNPVSEITNKLKNGSFNKTNREDIYKFKNTEFSESGISLLSEDMLLGNNIGTKFSSYSPVKFKNKSKINPLSMDFSEFATHSTDDNIKMGDSKCSFSTTHLAKCNRCAIKLNELIDKKVKEKLNDVFLNFNLNQIQQGLGRQNTEHFNTQAQPVSQSTGLPDAWKETLIIVSGALIAIFLICLITKTLRN